MANQFIVVAGTQLMNVDGVDVLRSHTDYFSSDAITYSVLCVVIEQRSWYWRLCIITVNQHCRYIRRHNDQQTSE